MNWRTRCTKYSPTCPLVFTSGRTYRTVLTTGRDENTSCPVGTEYTITTQRDRSYVYAVVSLTAGGPFVGGPIVTYIFSRVSVGSACVRVWKRDCDVTSLVEHRVKSLQQNGP